MSAFYVDYVESCEKPAIGCHLYSSFSVNYLSKTCFCGSKQQSEVFRIYFQYCLRDLLEIRAKTIKNLEF